MEILSRVVLVVVMVYLAALLVELIVGDVLMEICERWKETDHGLVRDEEENQTDDERSDDE